MIKEIHVFDLDGTLIDSSHRYKTVLKNGVPKIDLDHWRANSTPDKIAQDSLLPLADYYKRCLADPNIYVIVATSRVMDSASLAYINHKLGNPDKLIARQGEDDTRKGQDLKAKPIKAMLNLAQFQNATVHFWDDNVEYLDGFAQHIPSTILHYCESVQGY